MDLVEIKVIGLIPKELLNKVLTSINANINLISCKGEELFVEGLDVSVSLID